MYIDFLIKVFQQNREKDALIWRDNTYTYDWLLKRVRTWSTEIRKNGIGAATVVGVEADFSPNSVALLLTLIEEGAVFVPLTSSITEDKKEFMEIAEVEISVAIDHHDAVEIKRLPKTAAHELYEKLRRSRHPGLVLFSSGSTGKSKAAVHDMVPLLNKFKVRRKSVRTITFLLYDHIGGLNTLFYVLSNAGCVVALDDRSPESVCHTIEKHKVELLPTSPTFINLLLLSQAYKEYDLSSLTTVTYGTEPMPESTLKRFHDLFPSVRLLQTYGLSEVGILRSKSKRSDSLWVKVGGEGFQTRVVNHVLQIRAESTMLGYLNAPSPITQDGWFNTGDTVEVDGEYIKILGRQSQVINVGGEKVYPAEVESVIQEMDNVADVTIYSEKSRIVGNIPCAKVKLIEEESPKDFVIRLKKFCHQRLPSYKVPVKIHIIDEFEHSPRFKKTRQGTTDNHNRQ